MMQKFLCVVLLACSCVTSAELVEVPVEYEDRYRYLLSELRCLVCQNQNLADSGSGLAGDLRKEVKDMLLNGASNEEILEFMSARYGDFVLYKPPVTARTYLLWFGPFVLLLVGAFSIWRIVRKVDKQAQPERLSDAEQSELSRLSNKTDHIDD